MLMDITLRGPLPHARKLGNTPVALILLSLGFLGFLAVAAESVDSMQRVTQLRRAASEAMRTHYVIGQALSLMKDVETGQRGYMITGDEAFLQPYEKALKDFGGVHADLLRRLDMQEHSPVYHRRLEQLFDQRMAQANAMIQARRRQGASVLNNMQLYVDAKTLMDSLRVEVDVLQAHQLSVIALRTHQADDIAKRTFRLNVGLSILATLLILSSAGLLWKEKGRRDLAESRLNALNSSLEEMVEQRASALKRALEQIKSFAAELDRNIEAERRRLAREVHDQLGQVFTGLQMILLQAEAETASAFASGRWMKEIRRLLNDGVDIARRIAMELRPPLLDDFGLEAALSHYAQNSTPLGSLLVMVDAQDDDCLSALQANQCFRIVQEAMTNVIRHAGASEVQIEGRLIDDAYHLTIADNGRGPGDIRPNASGIRNMRERADLAQGELSFGPGEKEGSAVRVRLIPDRFNPQD